jgi:hypothetical protein
MKNLTPQYPMQPHQPPQGTTIIDNPDASVVSDDKLPPWLRGDGPGAPRARSQTPWLTPLSAADLLIREQTEEHLNAIIDLVQTGLREMRCLPDCPEDWQGLVTAYMIEDIDDLRISLIRLIEADQARMRHEYADHLRRKAGP